MRIGITTFGGDGGKSGISQYIIHLLREFRTLDSKVEFEVMVYRTEKNLFVPSGGTMKSLEFGESFRHPILNVAWHQISLHRWCRRRAYDVLFLPAANRRLPLWLPCPSVGTVHDFSSIHVTDKYDPARVFYIKRVLPVLIRRLTRVLTVSESSKRDIVQYAGIPRDRVTVTPLGVNHQTYYPRNKDAALARLEKRGIRSPYILFVSRIEHPGKNHVRLIRAFVRLKAADAIPHQLVLVGSDWMRSAEVHRTAEKSAFAYDILFTGFVPDAELPDLYSGSDLFVFPSLYEGFGLPVPEAMACGVPVACSDVSSMPEVAGEAAYLFDPYDEGAIAEAIRALVTNRQLRENAVKMGFQRSRDLTWSATASRTLEVLLEAACKNRQD